TRKCHGAEGKAERAHVERGVGPAVLGGPHRLEEAALAERLHPRAAGGVEVLVRQRGKRGIGPAREGFGEAAMAIVEKRPAQRFLKAHLNCPRKRASAWRRKRGTRVQNTPSPCQAPGRSPRPRSRSRLTSPIPYRACAWSWHWRK